jgi:glycosyltransferase involved in cell wall biosynthesis
LKKSEATRILTFGVVAGTKFLWESREAVLGKTPMRPLVIGVDAANIRAGGGVTHLSQLLSHADAQLRAEFRIILWGGTALLEKIESAPWIQKEHHPWLDRSLPWRLLWQQWKLPRLLREKQCEVLFSPGASLPMFLPVPAVTVSQNMLPFEPKERARFGLRWMRLKLWLLSLSQSSAFRRAKGVIFLTRYAERVVSKSLSRIAPAKALVAHGIETRFRLKPRPQNPLLGCHPDVPFKLLYVSIIDMYKHQATVAEAVARLRAQGVFVTIEFVGAAYRPALVRFKKVLERLDPKEEFLVYRGSMDFEKLHAKYQEADGFLFASSCENLPNILVEAMSAGLPIVCSQNGPMPEVLGESGFYFDPENRESIERAIRIMVESPKERLEKAEQAFQKSESYSWQKCASETFRFISECR